MNKKITAIAIGMAALAFVVSCEPSTVDGSDLSTNQDNPPVADVKINTCKPDSYGFVTSDLTVTNHSSKASTYTITIEYVDSAGTRIGEGAAFVDSLAPGQVAKTEGIGSVTGSVKTCKLLEVERFAS